MAELKGIRLELGWSPEMKDLLARFWKVPVPTEPFELRQGETVVDPALWHRRICEDIADGPKGPRAKYDALARDLKDFLGKSR